MVLALAHVALLSYSLCGGAPPSRSAVARAPASASMLLNGGRWPWERPAREDDDEAGKFVRHADLQPGCAPLGVVTAGFDDDALEMLADAVETAFAGPDGAISHVPIAVLAQADLRMQLRDVLARLEERDSVLPERPCAPRVPLVLLSGFSTTQTSAMVRALRGTGLRGGEGGQRSPMFAVAVPNALSKTLRVLIDELEGDHLANEKA